MITLGLFGAYDAEAPRLVTLMSAFTALGHRVVACNERPLGRGREAIARAPWLSAPTLARSQWRLWRRQQELQGVDALLVPYPGHALMPLARRVADGLGVPLLFDPFLSLYDTLVGDRELFSPGQPQARLYAQLDRWSLRLADRVLADTPAMAAYYIEAAGLAPQRLAVVPVGVDERVFCSLPPPQGPPYEVLFVGHMLPLHGIETIVTAAKLLEGDARVRFRLVGTGPVAVERLIAGALNIDYLPEVPFASLPALFARATICLGAFGHSDKAARVVPHKVFQAAACNRVVITREGVAMREAFGSEALVLVPPGDARALALAIGLLLDQPERRVALAQRAHDIVLARFGLAAIAAALEAALIVGVDGSFRAGAGMS